MVSKLKVMNTKFDRLVEIYISYMGLFAFDKVLEKFSPNLTSLSCSSIKSL